MSSGSTNKRIRFHGRLKKFYGLYQNRPKDSIRRKFIFLHIPRTGGSTFRYVLYYAYGYVNVLHDETEKDKVPIVGDGKIKPRLKNFDIIYGHFAYDKYNDLGLPYITWLRDPVERVISQYYSMRRHNITIRSPEIHKKLVIDQITLRQFAEHEEIQNMQCKFMSYRGIKEFDFIGIMEDYDNSLNRFSEWAGIPLMEKYEIRNRLAYDRFSVHPTDRELIKLLNQDDIRIYNQAYEKYVRKEKR